MIEYANLRTPISSSRDTYSLFLSHVSQQSSAILLYLGVPAKKPVPFPRKRPE